MNNLTPEDIGRICAAITLLSGLLGIWLGRRIERSIQVPARWL